MKVIFLDIDGVLATQRTRFDCFDGQCVSHLNKILEVTDARIVISSTWRIGHTTEELIEICKVGHDFDPGDKRPARVEDQNNRLIANAIVGRTIQLNEYMCRGREIDDWLKDAEAQGIPVESFVILDDDSDMEPHMGKLVKTDCYTGMSSEHAQEAIKLLNKLN